jgi:uncharacterized protein (TIGR03000 family)
VRCHTRLALACLTWFGLCLAAAPAEGPEKKATEQKATLRVLIPADTRLTIDGEPTRQTGPARLFWSPPLPPGKTYHYTLEWTVLRDGRAVPQKKIANVRAGEETVVDLREEADKKRTDVPYVPTPQAVVDRMLELAAVKKDDVVYDLGCGDGRIVVTAAKRYGCKASGFDIDPRRLEESRANVKDNGVEKLVTIEDKNIFDVDLRPASVVTMYLLPDVNVQLVPQLEKMKPGSRIVSHSFAIRGYRPKQVVEVPGDGGRRHWVYLWVTPLEKE